jgi:predicted metalloprotease with PDZ domain
MADVALRYRVELARPEDHLATVTVTVPCADAVVDGRVELTLPAWSPGSYLIRDYARYVRELTAHGDDGRPRAVTKLDKSTWSIDAGDLGGAAAARERPRTLTVRYRVYGHDLTVRTNHVDGSHAFLHGPATFLHVPALRRQPVEVIVEPPAGRGWALACGLDGGALAPAADRYTLTAPDVDALYDAPIHLGHVEAHTFTVDGVPFELALWGGRLPGGVFTVARLVEDLAAIAADHAARMGGPLAPPCLPFSRYTFIVMFTSDGYGGLEHRASSANLYNPAALATRKHYEGLLELLSHELFHAWNGKRIAPAALAASTFDYGREAYTRCLWVMEGLTSHYDRWALRTSGRITVKSFFDKVLDDWVRLQAVPGRAHHSLEEASFDAWIKLYKPDESNLNSTVSYYLKGGLAALALDLEIRRRSEGERSLDDVLRRLWREHGTSGTPHPEDVEALFAEAAGCDLRETFAAVVRGHDDPPLPRELIACGLELRAGHDPAQLAEGATPVWLGLTMSGLRVTGVHDASPAQVGGLAPGDELCALDRFRVTGEGDARGSLATRRPGDTVEVAVFRRGRLTLVPVVVGLAPPTRHELAAVAEPSAVQAAAYRAWMGDELPAGQTLAVLVSSSRWL